MSALPPTHVPPRLPCLVEPVVRAMQDSMEVLFLMEPSELSSDKYSCLVSAQGPVAETKMGEQALALAWRQNAYVPVRTS